MSLISNSWHDHLPLIEFSYNNSDHSNISTTHFEAIYGRRCWSTVGWFEVGKPFLLGLEIMYESIEKVRFIRDRLKTTYRMQKFYVDNRVRDL